jgi:hypothetical protein
LHDRGENVIRGRTDPADPRLGRADTPVSLGHRRADRAELAFLKAWGG